MSSYIKDRWVFFVLLLFLQLSLSLRLFPKKLEKIDCKKSHSAIQTFSMYTSHRDVLKYKYDNIYLILWLEVFLFHLLYIYWILLVLWAPDFKVQSFYFNQASFEGIVLCLFQIAHWILYMCFKELCQHLN